MCGQLYPTKRRPSGLLPSPSQWLMRLGTRKKKRRSRSSRSHYPPLKLQVMRCHSAPTLSVSLYSPHTASLYLVLTLSRSILFSHCLALSRSHTESVSLSHKLPHGVFLCQRLTPSRFIPRTCNLTAVWHSWSVSGRNAQDTRRNPSNGRTGWARPKTEADQLWWEAPGSSNCSGQA